MTDRVRFIALLFLAIPLLLTIPGTLVADEPYPSRPITIVVPFPPGGIADLTARPLAPALEKALKQPVVVTNKAGAGGAVGNQSVAIAKPDGYTLLLGLVSISTLPEVDTLFGRQPVYRRDQFVGIARLNADPPILVVPADKPWKNVREFIEDARKHPDITYVSSGLYGASHVPMEMLLHTAGGIKMRHLPTTGGAPSITALLGGHAAIWPSPPGLALPHIKSGKLRVLGAYGLTRLAAFPDVPTLKEQGYDVEYYLWAGLFAPKGIPPAVLKTLRDATRQAVADPEFKTWWDQDAQKLAAVIKRIGRVESK